MEGTADAVLAVVPSQRHGDERPLLWLLGGEHHADPELGQLEAELRDRWQVRRWSLADALAQRRTLQAIAADAVAEIRRHVAAAPCAVVDLSRSHGRLVAEVADQVLGEDCGLAFLAVIESETTCACEQCVRLEIAARDYRAPARPLPLCRFQLPAQPARQLAAILSEASIQAAGAPASTAPPMHRCLFELQRGDGSQAPVLCIPGAGASSTGFIELASALGPAWTVFGLEPRGLDGKLVPHASIEAAVRVYQRALDRFDPARPLHLIGHSHGGLIAFELGLRLQELGRMPASLTLIDSRELTPDGEAAEYTHAQVLEQLIRLYGQMAGRDLGLQAARLAALSPEACNDALHAALVATDTLPASSSPRMLDGPVRAFARCLRTRYRPAAIYRGPLGFVLLRDSGADSHGSLVHDVRRMSSWREWAPQASFWQGQGDHMSALKQPAVAVLAAWWNARVQAS